jgi:hypothetical protein
MSSHRSSGGANAIAALILIAISAYPRHARAEAPLPDITNAQAIIPWLRAAATTRADVVCLGDSNQLHQNNGWDHGWIKALDERFGLYATGLIAAGENVGYGAGSGYEYAVGSTVASGEFLYAGAPAELDRYMAPNLGMSPLNYLYVPQGSVGGAGAFHGLFIDRFSGIDVNAPLRLHLIRASFPEDSQGSFQLFARQGAIPYAVYAVGLNTPTASPLGYSATDSFIDLPPATRESSIHFTFAPTGQNAVGPFLAYYFRAENLARSVGVSSHTLYAFGGRSARDMAEALLAIDNDYLTLYFQSIRELALQQGQRPRILVRINTGLNDRNENDPSILSAILPGSSSEAFIDNISAIIFRIKVTWIINDWPEDELFFLLSVSHPVSNPDDPQLDAYRAASAAFALESPRCAAVNLGSLTAWGEMMVNGWYQFGGFDTNHLTLPGYEAIAAREVAALEDGACWRDLNSDRTFDAEDLYEWHRLRPDLNTDGKANYADLRCLQQAVRAQEQLDAATNQSDPPPLP